MLCRVQHLCSGEDPGQGTAGSVVSLGVAEKKGWGTPEPSAQPQCCWHPSLQWGALGISGGQTKPVWAELAE
jgi:hypothetical protein